MKRKVLLLALAILCACGKHSSPVGPAGSGDAAYVLRRITGPTSVAPGSTAEFKAFAVRGGSATEEDVTVQTIWTTSDPEVLRSDGNGRFTGLKEGDAGIVATLLTLTQRQLVLVVDAGTYAINGRVGDPAGPVGGARVEVIAGIGTGHVAIGDSSGGFRLYSVAGPITLRTTLGGYAVRENTFNVTAPNQSFGIELQPLVTPVSLAGQWQLTVEASPSCTTLPDEAMRRTYAASIQQNSSGLVVELSGANFVRDMSAFIGRALVNSVTFSLPTGQEDTHYELAELLSGNRIFSAVGTATGQVTPTAMALPFDGVIRVEGIAECTRPDHKFTFVKKK